MKDQIELRYGLEHFRKDWRLCSTGSNFLAESGFSDPKAADIASSAINELMELAFRSGAKIGEGHVQVRWMKEKDMHLALNVAIAPERTSALALQIRNFEAGAQAYFENHVAAADPPLLFGLSYLVHDFSASVGLWLTKNDLSVAVTIPADAWQSAH